MHKLSLDAGCTCPNVDGTLGTGGCNFCDPRSFSPGRRLKRRSLGEQLEQGIARLGRRYGAERFLAYFQPSTNTYGPLDELKRMWEEAAGHPQVVGLIVGTRPDCVDDPVLDELQRLARRTWVSIEYGLQSIHDDSLDWINRGHHYDAFLDAVRRTRQRGLRIGVHVILGLPCETRDQMLETAGELARLRIDAVKLHNLSVVKQTRLAEDWTAGRVRLPDRQEYVRLAVDFLERLCPSTVIDRLAGDAPPEFLLAPTWCLDKSGVRRDIQTELARRDTYQGRLHAG